MDSVSWMMDYLPVRMLALAQRAERGFADCLNACEHTDEGVIKIDDPEVFTRLLELRITSVVLGVAAFEAYLGYYAYQTAGKIEEQDPKITLAEYLEKHDLEEILKRQPNRLKRRHEVLMEENGRKPVARFLTSARISLEEKIIYWTLIRTRKMISYKDGYVKKLLRLVSIRDELLHPDLAYVEAKGSVGSSDELGDVFLHHRVPGDLTPGKSFSAEYVRETYGEGHFMWELLHIYPAREVQEAIQYLHRLDGSDQHFISISRAAELVDSSGKPVFEPLKKYTIEVSLEE